MSVGSSFVIRIGRAVVGIAGLAMAACSQPGAAPGGNPPPDEPEPPAKRDAARPPVVLPDAAVTTTPDAATPSPADAAVSDRAGDGAGASADGPAAAACPEPLVYCATLRPLPPTIKEAGFFPAAPDLAKLQPNMHGFEPTWPLWSNGLGKARQVIVPPGKTIDISRNRQVWEFPAGTLFLKTFFSDGPAGARKAVETRIIRRVEDDDPFKQWEFAVYRWNDAGTDATLLDLQARVPVPASAGGETFTHQIPSRDDCGKCHSANDTTVIGFDELRLNWTAPGQSKTELARFSELGVFNAAPPATPETVTDPDMDLRQVKGYVLGNCVHCHDGRNSNVVDMRPAVLVDNVVCQRTTSPGTLEGFRVQPRTPDASIFYLQLARVMRAGINPMPPVGVQRPDTAAVTVVRRWITNLRTVCK
jgi:hypothetical protein